MLDIRYYSNFLVNEVQKFREVGNRKEATGNRQQKRGNRNQLKTVPHQAANCCISSPDHEGSKSFLLATLFLPFYLSPSFKGRSFQLSVSLLRRSFPIGILRKRYQLSVPLDRSYLKFQVKHLLEKHYSGFHIDEPQWW